MANATVSSQYRPVPTQISSIAEIPSTPTSFILHSTNCLGSWGFGFALALAQSYPAAKVVYKDFCNSFQSQSSDNDNKNDTNIWPSRDLAGKCLIIPPQDEDIKRGNAPPVSIVCLFTSYGYGRAQAKGNNLNRPKRDSVDVILAQTRASLRESREQLGGPVGSGSIEEKDLVVWSPMINSGAFGVAWEETEALIMEVFEGWVERGSCCNRHAEQE